MFARAVVVLRVGTITARRLSIFDLDNAGVVIRAPLGVGLVLDFDATLPEQGERECFPLCAFANPVRHSGAGRHLQKESRGTGDRFYSSRWVVWNAE